MPHKTKNQIKEIYSPKIEEAYRTKREREWRELKKHSLYMCV